MIGKNRGRTSTAGPLAVDTLEAEVKDLIGRPVHALREIWRLRLGSEPPKFKSRDLMASLLAPDARFHPLLFARSERSSRLTIQTAFALAQRTDSRRADGLFTLPTIFHSGSSPLRLGPWSTWVVAKVSLR